ncbi:MAG: diphthamide biosynthesis enzyme Dph2 [Candidatus Bathyarchaeota archaeon]|nr:diphthamide biosynthesis enzyme Dph2 [Candidatus Bathyarchaeota archaeon]
MPAFDFEEERIKREIAKLGAKRVLLQMPEGLKPQATELAKIVEDSGALPLISVDPCYGACDVAINEAQSLGVGLIVHFGHVRMLKHEQVPTIYVEVRATAAVDAAIEKSLLLLAEYTKVGLAMSVQHLQTLDRAKEILTLAGKTVIIGDAGQMAYAGQVSGCNYSNAKSIAEEVDAFLFVGGGLFHALGIALSTAKPTVVADPYDNRAYSINEDAQKILRQRFASIQEAKEAKTFGVLIGLKPGQKHLDQALQVKALAEKSGKTAYLLVGREITPEALLEFPTVDAYVNTACPRISLDAPGKFQRPVLMVNEFRVVCGEVSWESLLKEGLFEN